LELLPAFTTNGGDDRLSINVKEKIGGELIKRTDEPMISQLNRYSNELSKKCEELRSGRTFHYSSKKKIIDEKNNPENEEVTRNLDSLLSDNFWNEENEIKVTPASHSGI
jgi:hypothetical protein